mmetsp:Transcript_11678/g.13218  ORF Transcript_11678/g.13218 Transcript_11678/m.13218 type:complete len:372 (+) Transcript_11678:28-1143(+)|eukprot:CAMPEP_0205822618 /NCGR_PEP_ID=MMETSP0206-20130828/13284_1 /ASSEMBLY_ACC=CAM_ASM_000279 /TAXON_ID=36767 /ORGANISM="Euplotes focardii, Strain TN1" /LENGTH=371 /DNA_ID=CAMNT_0053119043 /DNA_START=28 /DNA_END=1143 /DNA_ORIENTATION=+
MGQTGSTPADQFNVGGVRLPKALVEARARAVETHALVLAQAALEVRPTYRKKGSGDKTGDHEASTLNVMIVGQTGLGKATLVRSLFGFDLLGGIDREAKGLHSVKAKAAIGGHDNFNELDLEVLDTAGFGDFDDFDMNLAALEAELHQRLRKYAQLDTDINSYISRDDRIHLILYLASPHRFCEPDTLMVTALAKYANVAVVTAKSDLMNEEETEAYKLGVRATLNRWADQNARHPDLMHDGNFLFGNGGFPYSAVAGEREYSFTKDRASSEDMKYSDVPLLRHELLGPTMLDLKDKTELIYAHQFNDGNFQSPPWTSWKPYAGAAAGFVLAEAYNRWDDKGGLNIGLNHGVGLTCGGAAGLLHHIMYNRI